MSPTLGLIYPISPVKMQVLAVSISEREIRSLVSSQDKAGLNTQRWSLLEWHREWTLKVGPCMSSSLRPEVSLM
jgi:hypothetical protein